METTLKNQEMELIRNKERLQFFKVLQKFFIFSTKHWIKKRLDPCLMVALINRVSTLAKFQTTHLYC